MRSFLVTLLICSVTMSVTALCYMAVTPLLAKHYSVKVLYYSWLVVVLGLIIPFRPKCSNAIVKVNMPDSTAGPVVRIGTGAAAALHPVLIPFLRLCPLYPGGRLRRHYGWRV